MPRRCVRASLTSLDYVILNNYNHKLPDAADKYKMAAAAPI